MNKLITMRGAKLTLAAVSACFLAIHVAMIVIFSTCGVTPMVYFNIFSIAFYIFSFYLIRREWLVGFVVAVYLEVVAHMTLAVIYVGWDSGFQITLIGMNVLLFFAEYVGRCIQVRHVHALQWSILGMVCYLGARVVNGIWPNPYILPPEVSFGLSIAWGIVVFSINMVSLHLFVRITFKSEVLLSTEVSHDALTGLPNRYYMTDFLTKTAAEEGLEGRWIAIADIDDFKVVNDTYGHNCGDEVLRALAQILSSTIPGAEVCRWGGEEFLLTGKVETDMAAVREELDRLRLSVEAHSFWYDETRLHLTIAIGAAEYVPGQSTVEWVNSADQNLYVGKRNGKNQVVL